MATDSIDFNNLKPNMINKSNGIAAFLLEKPIPLDKIYEKVDDPVVKRMDHECFTINTPPIISYIRNLIETRKHMDYADMVYLAQLAYNEQSETSYEHVLHIIHPYYKFFGSVNLLESVAQLSEPLRTLVKVELNRLEKPPSGTLHDTGVDDAKIVQDVIREILEKRILYPERHLVPDMIRTFLYNRRDKIQMDFRAYQPANSVPLQFMRLAVAKGYAKLHSFNNGSNLISDNGYFSIHTTAATEFPVDHYLDFTPTDLGWMEIQSEAHNNPTGERNLLTA